MSIQEELLVGNSASSFAVVLQDIMTLRMVAGRPEVPEQAQVAAQKAICAGLGDPTPGLGAAAALSLGHAGLREPLRLPLGEPATPDEKSGEAKGPENGTSADVEMNGAPEKAGQ